MSDLRSLLHQLADHLAAVEPARGPRAQASLPFPPGQGESVSRALAAFAEGELSEAHYEQLPGTGDGGLLSAAARKVRNLVMATREVVGPSREQLERLRVSAQRMAEELPRQKLTISRSSEQLGQLGQRFSELARLAREYTESSERSAVIALNVGIEGLRVGGDVARTLSALGEELRRQCLRSAQGGRELTAAIEALGELSVQNAKTLDEARTEAQKMADLSLLSAKLAAELQRRDEGLQDAARGFRLIDADTEQLLGRIERTSEALQKDLHQARELLDQNARLSPEARQALAETLARTTAR